MHRQMPPHLPGNGDQMKETVILGIDPGTANPGVAVVKRDVAGKWFLLHSPILKSEDEFLKEIATIQRQFVLQGIACEAVGNAGAFKDVKQTGAAARIVGAEWIAKFLGIQLRVPCTLVAPSTWRLALTGSGKSTKKDVHRVIRLMVDGVPPLCSEHRLEAMAIAIAGARRLAL